MMEDNNNTTKGYGEVKVFSVVGGSLKDIPYD